MLTAWESSYFLFACANLFGKRRGLAHGYNYVVNGLTFFVRDNIAFNRCSVNYHGNNTLFYIVRVLDFDVVDAFTESTGQLEVTKALRYTRIDA